MKLGKRGCQQLGDDMTKTRAGELHLGDLAAILTHVRVTFAYQYALLTGFNAVHTDSGAPKHSEFQKLYMDFCYISFMVHMHAYSLKQCKRD